MKRITVERYAEPNEVGYAGLIEGETDNGQRWIIWLDAEGAPALYWPERGPDGVVVGEPVVLPTGKSGDPANP